MRYTRLLATAALALAMPFILTHCASLVSERLPLAYDAKSVGGPNSGAPLQLYLPPGDGPFPAVVVLHSCSGITDNTRTCATRLVSWGYAAVIVDSFGPRNVRSVCESPRTVGFSHGGSTALFAAIEERIPVDRGGRPFQAAVAYYPYCAAGTVVSPFATDALVLIGKDDTWTPADRCLKSVAARAHQARPLAIKVYPGAVHSFDLGSLPTVHISGHMVGGNPEAAPDSFATTKAFLDARLKAQ